MATRLTVEELRAVHEVSDRLEQLSEAADVAMAEARRAKGEWERHLRHLRLECGAGDDLALDPVTGEWKPMPQRQQAPPSQPTAGPLPLLDPGQ